MYSLCRLLRAAGHGPCWGQDLSHGMTMKAHRSTTVWNRQFAGKILVLQQNAVRQILQDASGKTANPGSGHCGRSREYCSITEDPEPAIFSTIPQSHRMRTWLVCDPTRDPRDLEPVLKSTGTTWLGGASYIFNVEQGTGLSSVSRRVASPCRWVRLGVMGAMRVNRHLWNGRIPVSKRLRELGTRIAIEGHQLRSV